MSLKLERPTKERHKEEKEKEYLTNRKYEEQNQQERIQSIKKLAE